MPAKRIIDEHKTNMKKTVDRLRQELRGVRTGRASTGLVENLKVDYYGSPTPLNQLASLAVPEAAMIVIKPFDPSVIKEIERAINDPQMKKNVQKIGAAIREEDGVARAVNLIQSLVNMHT